MAISKLPTTQVDPVMSFLGRLITAIVFIDQNDNQKVEGGEILQFAQTVGFDAFATFRDFSSKEFIEQLRDLDSDERKNEIELFAKEFKVKRQDVEWLIEDLIRHLEQTMVLFERSKTVFGKKVA